MEPSRTRWSVRATCAAHAVYCKTCLLGKITLIDDNKLPTKNLLCMKIALLTCPWWLDRQHWIRDCDITWNILSRLLVIPPKSNFLLAQYIGTNELDIVKQYGNKCAKSDFHVLVLQEVLYDEHILVLHSCLYLVFYFVYTTDYTGQSWQQVSWSISIPRCYSGRSYTLWSSQISKPWKTCFLEQLFKL